MQTIFLVNDREQRVTVVVEPWAWAKDLAPGEGMAVDHSELIDREIEISFQKDGSTLLNVPADGIRIRTGEASFEFGDDLPLPIVVPDGVNIERLLPRNFVSRWHDDNATKNPPQE